MNVHASSGRAKLAKRFAAMLGIGDGESVLRSARREISNPTENLDYYVAAKIAHGEFESREEFFLDTAPVDRELERGHASLTAAICDRIEEANRGDLAPLDMEAIKAEPAQQLRFRRQPKHRAAISPWPRTEFRRSRPGGRGRRRR